jgi:hypothetical protein
VGFENPRNKKQVSQEVMLEKPTYILRALGTVVDQEDNPIVAQKENTANTIVVGVGREQNYASRA